MNLWTYFANGEDVLCLDILQQHTEFNLRPNKTCVSSSKGLFQGNYNKKLSAPIVRLRNKTFYFHLLILKLQIFSSTYAKFDLKGKFNKRAVLP